MTYPETKTSLVCKCGYRLTNSDSWSCANKNGHYCPICLGTDVHDEGDIQ